MDTLKKYCLELAIRALQQNPSSASGIVGVAKVFEEYLTPIPATDVVEEESEQSTLKFGSFKEFLDYLDKMK